MIAVGIISDRPAELYLDGCRESLRKHLACYPNIVCHETYDRDHQLGMAGAVAASWAWALDFGVDYLLHVEEDFTFFDVPLSGMRAVLELNDHLAQVVLKRQPWSAEEKQAGGQIEVSPDDYAEFGARGLHWVEHDRLFSLNPCLIPRKTLELGAPVGHPLGFEAAFTKRCQDAGLRFAYYGRKSDAPRCEHVGHERGGQGWSW